MKYLSATLLVGLLTSGAAWAAEQQAKIAVSELSCPSCVYIVSSAMSEVPTVEVVSFLEGENWWEGTFTVTYDDASATPDMIVEAVLGYGYPASIATAGGS
uniref:heavy-metal-associated domain-containing protein n=1 Tax=Yoonia sp. TaxID=2212373 RepID=UPI0040484498